MQKWARKWNTSARCTLTNTQMLIETMTLHNSVDNLKSDYQIQRKRSTYPITRSRNETAHFTRIVNWPLVHFVRLTLVHFNQRMRNGIGTWTAHTPLKPVFSKVQKLDVILHCIVQFAMCGTMAHVFSYPFELSALHLENSKNEKFVENFSNTLSACGHFEQATDQICARSPVTEAEKPNKNLWARAPEMLA